MMTSTLPDAMRKTNSLKLACQAYVALYEDLQSKHKGTILNDVETTEGIVRLLESLVFAPTVVSTTEDPLSPDKMRNLRAHVAALHEKATDGTLELTVWDGKAETKQKVTVRLPNLEDAKIMSASLRRLLLWDEEANPSLVAQYYLDQEEYLTNLSSKIAAFKNCDGTPAKMNDLYTGVGLLMLVCEQRRLHVDSTASVIKLLRDGNRIGVWKGTGHWAYMSENLVTAQLDGCTLKPRTQRAVKSHLGAGTEVLNLYTATLRLCDKNITATEKKICEMSSNTARKSLREKLHPVLFGAVEQMQSSLGKESLSGLMKFVFCQLNSFTHKLDGYVCPHPSMINQDGVDAFLADKEITMYTIGLLDYFMKVPKAVLTAGYNSIDQITFTIANSCIGNVYGPRDYANEIFGLKCYNRVELTRPGLRFGGAEDCPTFSVKAQNKDKTVNHYRRRQEDAGNQCVLINNGARNTAYTVDTARVDVSHPRRAVPSKKLRDAEQRIAEMIMDQKAMTEMQEELKTLHEGTYETKVIRQLGYFNNIDVQKDVLMDEIDVVAVPYETEVAELIAMWSELGV